MSDEMKQILIIDVSLWQDMIENVLEIKDTHVREVMTPLVDVVAIDSGAKLIDFQKLWVTHQYSRFVNIHILMLIFTIITRFCFDWRFVEIHILVLVFIFITGLGFEGDVFLPGYLYLSSVLIIL